LAEAQNGPFSSGTIAILDGVAAFASRREEWRVFRGFRGMPKRKRVNTLLRNWPLECSRGRPLLWEEQSIVTFIRLNAIRQIAEPAFFQKLYKPALDRRKLHQLIAADPLR
jgi:hypothetical protein